LIDALDLDDIMPGESHGDFDESVNTQGQFLTDSHPVFAQIRTIASISDVSHRSYDEMFPTHREFIPNSRFSEL
jgi:hypothetical protein